MTDQALNEIEHERAECWAPDRSYSEQIDRLAQHLDVIDQKLRIMIEINAEKLKKIANARQIAKSNQRSVDNPDEISKSIDEWVGIAMTWLHHRLDKLRRKFSTLFNKRKFKNCL